MFVSSSFLVVFLLLIKLSDLHLQTYQILNSDDHTNFLKRNGRNPADYRPDIVHQALLSILDSPLNKAGKVRAVYVRTGKGVLFEVKPHGRIPRTYKCFAGIMYAKGPGGVGQEAATLEIKEEMGKDGGRDGGNVSKATTAMASLRSGSRLRSKKGKWGSKGERERGRPWRKRREMRDKKGGRDHD
ncbi:hypothetical protein EUGRSUZ_A02611 [Eucalyptus grandis]|uniref:Uncharacterized protein n=1 Tax=Eucalyptus grandis TaxID=71139 RepID=A0ACC3M841_EUCGR|nr:hypothetical protein EUGRSUZ_A02611 [Eucalyptus grandis]